MINDSFVFWGGKWERKRLGVWLDIPELLDHFSYISFTRRKRQENLTVWSAQGEEGLQVEWGYWGNIMAVAGRNLANSTRYISGDFIGVINNKKVTGKKVH